MLLITAGEVPAADRALEQHVADQSELGLGMVEDDVAGRVAGAMADIEGQVADRDLIAVDQIAIGFERAAVDAVFLAILLEPVDPEQIVLVRAFDRHAEFLGEHAGLAAMVDMAVGHQDFFDGHASLLRGTRQQLHARIAEALETQSPDVMENQPELFAQHYAEAGLAEKAVAYWGKAGRRSAARSAMAEAAAQFQKGLDQLALLSDNSEHQRQELEICSSLGAVLLVVKGYAAPETGRAYARAQELWEKLGSPSEFLHVPYGQSSYHVHLGELELALRLDEGLLRLSRQRNDSAGLVLGHLSSGRNLMFAGRFAASRSQLEEVLSLYDPISHRSLGHLHPLTTTQAYLGNVLFCLGFPDQALARSSASIAAARKLAHPPSLAVSLAIGARLLAVIGGDTALDERAGQLVEVATEQGFAMWRAQGTIYRGWAKLKSGDVTEGISLLRGGLAAYRATGPEMWMAHYLDLLAVACEIAGQIAEGLTLSDEALQIAERTGERWCAAELNRHKGQLLLRQRHSEVAEELYRKALSIAQEQKAKLWELRAAVSLARLCRDQGRRAEARDLLAPVYGWFTEGFDTPDLKQAKALLDELAGA